MIKVLVDTDVIYDLLAKREPYYIFAAILFTKADHNKVKLFISALTIANMHYMLSRLKSDKEARKILNRFKVLVSIIPLDQKILELALNSDFKDFEDAIQYYSAIENNVEILLTRNLRDYKKAKIPVMTAEGFIKTN